VVHGHARRQSRQQAGDGQYHRAAQRHAWIGPPDGLPGFAQHQHRQHQRRRPAIEEPEDHGALQHQHRQIQMAHHLADDHIGRGLEDLAQIVAPPRIAFTQIAQHGLARGRRNQPLHRPLERHP